MTNTHKMTRQEFIKELELREKRRKKRRYKRYARNVVLFSLAVFATNATVAYALDKGTEQSDNPKIIIKMTEPTPVELTIKVVGQDDASYDVIDKGGNLVNSEIINDNVEVYAIIEPQVETAETAIANSEKTDEAAGEIEESSYEKNESKEDPPIVQTLDYSYENTPQYVKYMNLTATEKEYFAEAANEFHVSESMMVGICYNESRFNANAINLNTNGTTDWGISQCNDTTFSFLNSALGITSMSDVLDMETGIRACAALLAHYENLGLSGNDVLLAYQEGIGNYKEVKQGNDVPWEAYYKVLENIEIYNSILQM